MIDSHGLNDEEVLESRKKNGSNALKEIKSNSLWHLFIESLGDPIIKILLIALAIKVIFLFKDFDWYETIGIVIAIFVASFISSISEYGSEKAFKRMQEEAALISCKVKRNGKITLVKIDDIVKGDIVILEQGDKVPADGVIINGSVGVDESSLNGESKEVFKANNKGSMSDAKVYRGSVVSSLKGEMLVTSVGNNTVYGKMSLELGEKAPTSPLKLRLRDLALTISKIGYVGSFLVSFSYLFSKVVIENNFDTNLIIQTLTNFPVMFGYILYALTLSVTIIVVAVPEGLPMMITLVLSSNMKRMLKNNVLVRKLVGIETAGSLNILFTDKTGTLTKGCLEVVELLDGNGQRFGNEIELLKYPKYQEIVKTNIVYNNDSKKESGKIIGGNITDRALLSFINTPIENNLKVIKKVPFDSSKKYSLTMIDNDGKINLIKGAPEKILPFCTMFYDTDGKKKPLKNKERLEKYLKDMTRRGIRVIALATMDPYREEFKNLSFVCLLSIKDDIRPEAKEGIKLVEEAGIRTVMITGDNVDTAKSIGKEIGLVNNSDDVIITSNELNKMTDSELVKIIPKLRIVARSLPSDKSRLVKVARSMNLVVGMTGDGVNDAPSLKAADVGFAMGSGTEVSKDAADIVILDDNFLSISKAILFGRTIFKSIRKFIICQLTINLSAIGLSFVGFFIGIDTPVTVIQMLWVNMVMDTLTGLAFAFEPPLLEYMKEMPKKKDEPIINKYMFGEIFFTGTYSFILCILFLKHPFFLNLYGGNISHLMSAFFGLFIFIDIFNSFNARTNRLNLFANLLKNKVFLTIVFIVAIVQIALIYFGGEMFRTTFLSFKEFEIMILMAFTVIPVDFLRKFYLRKKGIIGGV